MNKMLFFIFISLYLFIGIVYRIGEFDLWPALQQQ